MISRWPSSKTKRAPQKVHPLPAPTLIRRPEPLVLRPRPRSVHAPVPQLRAIDLEPVLLRAERDAPRSKPVTEGDKKPRFSIGDRVRTTPAAGPFAGRVGEVTQITRFATVVVRFDEPAGCTEELFHSSDGSDLEPAAPPVAIHWSQGARDPDAPVAAPRPAGSRFVKGQRVRCVDAGVWKGSRLTVGREYTITGVDGDGDVWVTGDNGAPHTCCHPQRFEPLPSETPERGDWTPPGWTRLPGNVVEYAYDKNEHGNWDRVVSQVSPRSGTFGAFTNGSDEVRGGAALPLAQACCAALSIELHELSPTQGFYAAHPSFTDGPVAYGRDAESCARAALAALHARGMR